MINDLWDRFELLRGYVEESILKGEDLDGSRPSFSGDDAGRTGQFHYDLVNLDFLGGIGYRDRTGSKRVNALRRLIERQRGSGFLFLLTLNVRDGIGDDLSEYLEGARRTTVSHEVRSALEWYTECGSGMKDYRLKAAVPLVIRRESESQGFDCHCYPVVAYDGDTQSRMVHFVFLLRPAVSVLHAFSKQTEADVIGQPMLQVRGEKIQIAVKQHPGFDFGRCESVLGFLPEATRQQVISSVSASVRAS